MDGNEQINKILNMLEEGKITSSEAKELMSKVNNKSYFDDFLTFVKKLELKEKVNTVVNSTSMQKTVHTIKDKFGGLKIDQNKFRFDKNYVISLEQEVSLDLHVNNSNIMIDRSLDDNLYIKMSYSSELDDDNLELIFQDNWYFFDLDKESISNINFSLELPDKYIDQINFSGNNANINLKNLNTNTGMLIKLQTGKVILDKVFIDKLQISIAKLSFISKSSNVRCLEVSGDKVDFNANETDFADLTFIGYKGSFTLRQKTNVFFNKMWNVEYSIGNISLCIPKDKNIAKKIVLNLPNGSAVVNLPKMKFRGTAFGREILEDKWYAQSPNKVFINVITFQSNITIKN